MTKSEIKKAFEKVAGQRVTITGRNHPHRYKNGIASEVFRLESLKKWGINVILDGGGMAGIFDPKEIETLTPNTK